MRTVPGQIAAKLMPAADLIADRGLDQTKIEDLAAATGVPKATLYYYFAGKEEILTFLLQDGLRRIADEVAIAVQSPGSAADRLGLVIRAQLEVMAEQPALCRALASDLGRAGRIPEIAAAIQDAYLRPVRDLLAEGASDGSLRALPDPEVAATVVFGAVSITGLTLLATVGDLPADRAAQDVLAVLMRGLTVER